MQLYRSLNGSRSLPLDLPIAKQAQRRFYDRVYLPLDQYGLEPGDEIKLFGRVEDNDPAGGKGVEIHLCLRSSVEAPPGSGLIPARGRTIRGLVFPP